MSLVFFFLLMWLLCVYTVGNKIIARARPPKVRNNLDWVQTFTLARYRVVCFSSSFCIGGGSQQSNSNKKRKQIGLARSRPHFPAPCRRPGAEKQRQVTSPRQHTLSVLSVSFSDTSDISQTSLRHLSDTSGTSGTSDLSAFSDCSDRSDCSDQSDISVLVREALSDPLGRVAVHGSVAPP